MFLRGLIRICWDHFLKELRHRAQLGNQAFWWIVNNSTPPPTGWSAIGGGQGGEHFCYLREKKQMGSYLITLFFLCDFRGKEYYLVSLRSVQIWIFCLWLKYFVNSKNYSRSNGTKGNFKPRKYLPLNSVLQALLSVTCFSEGLAGLQHNRKKCTSSSTGLENVFNF